MKDAKSLLYATSMQRALELQMKWESASKNAELHELGEILVQFHYYLNSLELDKMSWELERIELIKENTYLLSRAIKAEEELDKIKGTEVDFTAKINERITIQEKLNNIKPSRRNGAGHNKKFIKPKF